MLADINALKNEFIGKTFGLLTIEDVFRDTLRKCLMFSCKCACGTIKNVPKSNILSGKVKSCGCYRYTEECHKKMYAWHDDSLKMAAHREKCIQWCDNHHDKMLEIAEINRQSRKNGPAKFAAIAKNVQSAHRANRSNCDFSLLKDHVSSDDFSRLCNGEITTRDIINIKCPVCGNTSPHTLHNVFRIRTNSLRYNIPMCPKCKSLYASSKYEQEIADFISTFYDGECIRNSREIISPLELDLYYPGKKIAIEFNGDYWHSENGKPRDYHYSKFKQCQSLEILLVSIFESAWQAKKDDIKSYLADIFNNVENRLSFNEEITLMDNNYPSYKYYKLQLEHIEDYFIYRGCRVYTCGYSVISNV